MRDPLSAVLASVVVTAAIAAQDWPHWRGPSYDGSSPAKGLPREIAKDKSVLWSVPLPGPAACTPIVLGERVFLTSVDSERQTLVAMCVRRTDGKVLWQKDAGSGYTLPGGTPIGHDHQADYASPSPASDGERVVFFFGNGDLVGYTLEGEELWRRNLQQDYGNFAFQWTFSASPTILGGKAFLPVLQRDTPVGRGGGRRGRGGQNQPASPPQGESSARPPSESFLLAIDPKTGKTLYKRTRPSPARMESLESYTTPIPWQGPDGDAQIVIVGGDVLTSHDPATGDELWRWGTWNEGHRQGAWRLVPTVVLGDGMALVCAPKREPVYAVRAGGKGALGADALIWRSEGRPNPVSSDVPSPAFYEGHFYVLSDVRNALSKVHAKTGEVAWTTALSSVALWRASPTAADGCIFCLNHRGDLVVVDAKDGRIVHEAALGDDPDGDKARSSVVVAHGCVLVRTHGKLWCFGAAR